jgi:hypothetical protein
VHLICCIHVVCCLLKRPTCCLLFSIPFIFLHIILSLPQCHLTIDLIVTSSHRYKIHAFLRREKVIPSRIYLRVHSLTSLAANYFFLNLLQFKTISFHYSFCFPLSILFIFSIVCEKFYKFKTMNILYSDFYSNEIDDKVLLNYICVIIFSFSWYVRFKHFNLICFFNDLWEILRI